VLGAHPHATVNTSADGWKLDTTLSMLVTVHTYTSQWVHSMLPDDSPRDAPQGTNAGHVEHPRRAVRFQTVIATTKTPPIASETEEDGPDALTAALIGALAVAILTFVSFEWFGGAIS